MSDHLKAISVLNANAIGLRTALGNRRREEAKAQADLAQATRERERVESELRSVEYTIAVLTPAPELVEDED